MSDDEFYEDDESIEDLRSAWNAGEKGTTSGPRDLNQRARSIVDRAVAAIEGRDVAVVLRVVESGTSAATTVVVDGGDASGHVLDRVEVSEYQVG